MESKSFPSNQIKPVVAGVASNIAYKLKVNVKVVRLMFVLLYLFFGLGLVIYVWAWKKHDQQSGQLTLG